MFIYDNICIDNYLISTNNEERCSVIALFENKLILGNLTIEHFINNFFSIFLFFILKT